MKSFVQTIILLIITNISFAQTNYYVDNSLGTDAPGNGTSPGASAWKTIEYAIDNVANPNSDSIIINISNGVYNLSNNQIDINRNFLNLTLIGEGIDSTYIQSAADTSLSNSRVIKIYAGNTVYLKNLTVRYGRITTPDVSGGGILNDRGTLTIDFCMVAENSGSSTIDGIGGGVANIEGILTINNSTVSFNTGSANGQGGGIGSIDGTLNVYNSTIYNNHAPFTVGGIFVVSYNTNSIFNIENSTIYGNSADTAYGGIRITIFGYPSSIFNVTSNINSCTIFNNSTLGVRGGIGLSTPSNFSIKNSIVAGNSSGFGPSDLSGVPGLSTIVNSGGYNIFQSYDNLTINDTSKDITWVDPLLLPLAENNTTNGTWTCAISENSPAKDRIPFDSPNGDPLMDQRGYQRVGNYDIGAYEISNIIGLTAKVQVINNSADITADSIDIYINGELAISGLGFRKATPLLDLSAGKTLNIGIALGNSASVADTLKNFPVVFTASEKYIVFTDGLLTGGYAPNPDGRNTNLNLFVKDMVRETAVSSGVDLFVLHGSTDAPAVDVKVRELSDTTIVNNAAYGDITDYITVPAQDVTLDLYLANGTSFVSSFTAPLSILNGEAATVFASGFLNPTTNQNGAPFGLFAALPNGTVLQFPIAPSVIMVTPDTLTGFTYVDGFGPSTSRSYSLSGINLNPADGNITVAGSANYKVSTNNTIFSDTLKVAYAGGMLSDTTIYVRLKAGLTSGDFDGEAISNAGGGATTRDVTVKGSVTFLPILAIDSLKENDANGVTKMLNDTINTTGIVTSILQLGTGTSGPGTIQNSNTAVSIYGSTFTGTPGLQMGDSVVVYNWKVTNYNGLTELSSTSASSLEIVSSEHTVNPLFVTIPQIKNEGWDGFEKYESMYAQINDVKFVQSGKFDVGTSSGVNYQIFNGPDTLDFRVVKTNTSLLGKDIPTGTVQITGVIQQYKSSAPFNAGYEIFPLDSSAIQIINGIADNNESKVITYQLDQNYPNPFNPTTKIRFSIPQAGNVKLTVFNILGQEVKTLVNEEMAAGVHSIDFGASNLSSGIYIYRIETGSFVQTRKMTLMK
jgi:hypothetical protein